MAVEKIMLLQPPPFLFNNQWFGTLFSFHNLNSVDSISTINFYKLNSIIKVEMELPLLVL